MTPPSGAQAQPEIRRERHFGDRIMRCYADRPSGLNAMFARAVAADPDGEAVVDGDLRVSYAELAAAVEARAGWLGRLGIAAGDRVALLLANRLELVELLLAVAHLGAIAVPINIREQTPQIGFILGHCGAKLLVHEPSLAERLPDREDLPHLVHVAAAGAPPPPAADEPIPAAAEREEDVAVILYTSGTTGRPKGAMLTHLNICHSCIAFAQAMELGRGERSLLAVPASHVTGLVANIFTMIHVAGCTVVMRSFDARAFLELAAAERITHTLIVPAMYNLCLLRADFADFDLSAWRIGGYGGAPMPEATIAALAEKLPGLILVNAYGATETTSPTTIMPLGATSGHSASVGRVVPCGELVVVDDDGREVPPGETGELWIAGPMVVPGYWSDPEVTAKSFTAGHWRSGDIGAIDGEGFVRIFDRKKDVIIRGGYNISSAEVENILAHHPGVAECAVVPYADPVLGEKTCAFVRCKADPPEEADLKAFCAARLADYMVPDRIAFLDEPLPRNANGKVLKTLLRERAATAR